jgi:hypothetical protein
MQNKFPSVVTLCKIQGVSKDVAETIRFIMKARTRETLENMSLYDTYYQKTGKYMYNEHSTTELKFQMIETLLYSAGIGHGLEYIHCYNGLHGIEYINMGDTYILTLCFYHGEFIVSSWGDIVEKHMERYQ